MKILELAELYQLEQKIKVSAEFFVARRSLGLTQKELGAELGISESHVCRIENGYRPSRKLVIRLADLLIKRQ